MVDRYLANRLKRDPSNPDAPYSTRLQLGPHRFRIQRGPEHVRAHIDVEVPRGVQVLRGPQGDPPDSEAGDLLLTVPGVAAVLDPRFGVQVDEQGVVVWELGTGTRLLEVANTAEAIAIALDPWLVAKPSAPWASVLEVGLADLTPRFDEQGGRARVQLRHADADLMAELRITPVSEERFDVEIEAELDDGAVLESLRLGEAAWPFAFADSVECADPVVDQAFTVRSKAGAALMKAIAPHLRGYLDFGGRGFDLEIEPKHLTADARLPRTLVSRWVWAMADVWRLGSLGFLRVGGEEEPARRWFGALPGTEPTGVVVQVGAARATGWSRAGEDLAREVGASSVDESRVFRGEYDVVGRAGDHEIVVSLRAPGEALFLASCAVPWRFTYTQDPSADEGDVDQVAVLFHRWRRTDARFHVSARAEHGDLDRASPGVGVVRVWIQGIGPNGLRDVWNALGSLLRMKDPDASRQPTELFLDAVRKSDITLGPDGVELGHRKGSLFWGEPWHVLHETRLTLKARCHEALRDLDVCFDPLGRPLVTEGTGDIGERLQRPYRWLQEAQARKQPTFALKRAGGELRCYVRADRPTLPIALAAMAEIWRIAG